LTPAVFASVKRAGAKPLPYLFACAFIANAASFILPISNPANLVVFESRLPGVVSWVHTFGLPSVASVLATFFVLLFWFRDALSQPLESLRTEIAPRLGACGKLTAAGLLAVILVLITASSLRWQLGLPTFLAAFVIVAGISIKKRSMPVQVLKDVAWSVVPLVAGLFVLVEGLNQAGALRLTHRLLRSAGELPNAWGQFSAAFGVGLASNIANNLPVGLVSGMAVHRDGISDGIRNAVLVGVDLGPNLSVTGSLATILWLMALRREGEKVSGFAFFRIGLVAMPLALGFAIWALY
jgi:arsenical pump membrane protein